ncbi:hypothetical protein BSLG_007008 [Batrachochytrium salamandrivorans]|nr:hypothetical protein BSLG_007008 [Batrachochytrium salamandrivorans]
MSFNLQRTLSSKVHKQYWGIPSSSVDWCEVNYEVTEYVAEYFNTLSSFAMALVGLLGVIMHPWAERRFHVAFLSTVAVGLGSVAFHGTLGKFSQALDEVPMLYSALSFSYIGICERYTPSASNQHYLALLLVFHSIFTTLLVTISEGYWQFFLFHLSFGTAQIYAIIQAVCIYRDRISKLPYAKSASMQRGEMYDVDESRQPLLDRRNNMDVTISTDGKGALFNRRTSIDDTTSNMSRKLNKIQPLDPIVWTFRRGIFAYGTAAICWFADMFLCEYINPHYEGAILPVNPQFHAWWHILVSIGLYHLALLTLAARVNSKYGSGRSKLLFWLGIIPYINLVPKVPETAISVKVHPKTGNHRL